MRFEVSIGKDKAPKLVETEAATGPKARNRYQSQKFVVNSLRTKIRVIVRVRV